MMSGSSALFMMLLGAMTMAVIVLLHLAYDVSTERQRLRRRLDLLASNPRPRPSFGAAAVPDMAPRHRIIAASLRGKTLELARWLEPLHLPARLVPHLLIVLRIASASALTSTLCLIGNRAFGLNGFTHLLPIGLIGGVLGWLVPDVIANRLALRRRREVARGLADAIELLVIAVEAGLSLEDALGRVVTELWRSQPAIAEELAITAADLKILPNRDDALHRLAERVDLPSVHSVVTTLSQTLRYGTPLAEALRVVASELRNEALFRLEEQANRLPVLLTVPMVLFILPALFLIIGGPAFLRVLAAVGQ